MKWNLLGLMAAAVLLSGSVFAQQKTLYVADTKAAPSLKAELGSGLKAAHLGRILEAIDGHLTAEITASGKFKMVERTDNLAKLEEEQALAAFGKVAENGAESDAMVGAELALFVTVDAFQESSEGGVFNGVHRQKCRFQLSAQMRIVDTSTSEILTASNIQVERYEVADVATMGDPTARFDALIPQVTRDLAAKSVRQLVSVTFPPKVIDVDEEVITINAGADVFKVGDLCNLYGKTRTVTDPDTGVSRKIKGRLMGQVRIIDVEADYAQAEVIGKAKAVIGAQVKPKAAGVKR